MYIGLFPIAPESDCLLASPPSSPCLVSSFPTRFRCLLVLSCCFQLVSVVAVVLLSIISSHFPHCFWSSPPSPIVVFEFLTVAESQDLFYRSTGPINIGTCYAECLVLLPTSPSYFRPSASTPNTPQPYTSRTHLHLPPPFAPPSKRQYFTMEIAMVG